MRVRARARVRVRELHLEPTARLLGVGQLDQAALAIWEHVERRHHADEQARVGVQRHRRRLLHRTLPHRTLAAATPGAAAAHHRRPVGGGRPG